MRILYSFPHAIGAPGIGHTAWHQVQALVDAGHRVTVWAASVARPLSGLAGLHTSVSAGRARVPHRVLGVDRTMAWHDAVTSRWLARHAGDVDVVHVWPGAALRTAAAGRTAGVPCVREVPNTHTAHAYEVVAAELARLGMTAQAGHSHTLNESRLATELREYATVDALLVPSEAVRRSFEGRGVPDGRLLRHQYGYDPAVTPTTRPGRTGGLVAAFVGRCEPRKGLHHALAAWLRSDAGTGGRLLIAGAFVPGYSDLLGADLVAPGVEVLGFSGSVGDVYAQADVLLLPSIEEGSALVTYEAQAYGCALLVSDASGAVLQDGVQGLEHRAGDVETLAAQLRLLSGDRARLTQLQDGAWAARPSLTWAAAARRLEDAYGRVVRPVGTPPR